MSTSNLQIIDNILKVTLPNELPGNELVSMIASQLDELIVTNQLPQTKLLKIEGRLTILLGYLFTDKLSDLYSTIAVSVPPLNAYIVVISKSDDYPLGSRIDFDSQKLYQVDNQLIASEISFFIYWSEDILQAKLNRFVKVDGDVIVKDVAKQLDSLTSTSRKNQKLLKINGRCTVPAAFILAEYFQHYYEAIAINDPKIGKEGYDGYVVAMSKTATYPLGQIIEIPNPITYKRKVVLCGPANTGKTCLRDGLKSALLELKEAPESYVISGCPDGDGAWFTETAQKNPQLARKLKDEWKSKFTPEFAQAKAKEIKSINYHLLVFDVGGKITPENELIMAEATHSVILAKSSDEVKLWQDFCEKLNLPVVAIIMSDYDGQEDTLTQVSPLPLRGSVHYLDRSENVTNRPTIQALAKLLSNL